MAGPQKYDPASNPAVDGAQELPLGDFSPEEMERIRRLDVDNIRRKAAAGEVLTREQLKRLDLALPDSEVGEEFAETQEALCEALHVGDRKSIQRWMKEPGCPGKDDQGRYNVKDWRTWMATQGKRQSTKGTAIEKQREKIMALDVRLKEIELAEKMGRVIDREECTTVLLELVTKVTQALRALKHSLAPKVVGESVPEANKRIGADIDSVLEGLAAIPEGAKKKMFWQSVSMLLSSHLRTLLHGDTPGTISSCTPAGTSTPI